MFINVEINLYLRYNNYIIGVIYEKKKILRKILLIFFIIIIIFLILGTGLFIYIAKTAPEFDTSILYKSEPTTILDKNNQSDLVEVKKN